MESIVCFKKKCFIAFVFKNESFQLQDLAAYWCTVQWQKAEAWHG